MGKQLKYLKSMLMILFIQQAVACANVQVEEEIDSPETPTEIVIGNEQMAAYLPLLKNKKVAIVANHTSVVGHKHLVDTLLGLGVEISKVFSPEHGFRGTADAGEKVKDDLDEATGLPIISLYGSNKKPNVEDLKDIEIILFDIQDVGVRFYTYISSLHYVMEAAAENEIPLVVLDRPNPNAHYIDGPVLNLSFHSFVGMHPVPVVHGMTIGEYAQMINGEKWLKNEVQCDLKVISCLHYDHKKVYRLPLAPSPNLPNMRAIYLYPSLCFFEGTPISVGRGTAAPFQQIGHPKLSSYKHTFVPKPSFGASNPKLNKQKCYGIDFSMLSEDSLRVEKLNLSYLLEIYQQFGKKEAFFTSFFKLLAGTDQLQKNIESGMSEEEIRSQWKSDIEKFKQIRKKYLLYND